MRLNRRRRPRINGTCIAGSPADPRDWFRVKDGIAYPMHGRWNPDPAGIAKGGEAAWGEFLCAVKAERPIRGCESCPAFRHRPSGRDGMGPNGEPLSLTPAEYELWLDDDALYVFKEKGGVSVAARAHWVDPRDDPEVAEYLNDQARRWRAAHPGADKRKRKRADYMRDYMRQRRLLARSTDTAGLAGAHSENGNE